MLAVSCQGFGNLIQFMMPASRRRSTCSPCLVCFALLCFLRAARRRGSMPPALAKEWCQGCEALDYLFVVQACNCLSNIAILKRDPIPSWYVFNARTFSHKWRGWGPPAGRGGRAHHNRTTTTARAWTGDLEKHDEEILVTSIYWFTLPIIRAINNTRH